MASNTIVHPIKIVWLTRFKRKEWMPKHKYSYVQNFHINNENGIPFIRKHLNKKTIEDSKSHIKKLVIMHYLIRRLELSHSTDFNIFLPMGVNWSDVLFIFLLKYKKISIIAWNFIISWVISISVLEKLCIFIKPEWLKSELSSINKPLKSWKE